jgi:lipoate-protein ligase A
MRRSGEAAVVDRTDPLTWRVVVDGVGRSGADNMALDESLLHDAAATGTPALRLYRWDPPCLSLGRNQQTLADEPRGIAVVRRPTGGGAVWHEHEVTYAVAAPVAVFGSLRAAYYAIHQVIAGALRSLGADVALAPDPPTGTGPSPICFAKPARGEILASGRKLVGSAQVRKRHAFLQHGSILLDGSQANRFERERARGSGEAYGTTLRTVLGRVVTFDEVTEAIVRAWDADSPRLPPPLSGAAGPPSQS